jgi:hypothetical protein
MRTREMSGASERRALDRADGAGGCELLGNAEPMLGLGEQHHAAVGTDATAIEGSGYLLGANGWKRERQHRIVRHWGQSSMPYCGIDIR